MIDWYLIKILLALMLATCITRMAILLFPRKTIRSNFMREFNKYMPAIVLTILIIYGVKDANWNVQTLLTGSGSEGKFAFRELIGISVTAVVHVIARRNALLSMLCGTGVYIGLNGII